MNKKLKYLTTMSLNKKIKTKWFLFANIIIFLLVIGIINGDSIIKLFGGDFDETTNLIIQDNTNLVYDKFSDNFNNNISYMEDGIKTKIKKSNIDIDKQKEELKDKDILVIINNDTNNFIKAEVIVKEKIDTILYSVINASLNQIKTNIALNYYGIDSNKLAMVEKPIDIIKTSLNEDNSKEDNKLILGTIFPIITLPLFMLIIFLVQMIGAEINEEKSTKSMEIIISNVSPGVHFTSKLLSGNIFALLQGSLLIIYSTIAIGLRYLLNGGNLIGDSTFANQIVSSFNNVGGIDKIITILPFAFSLIAVTFIAYSLLAGILASITTNMEDFQQLQTPIIIISLVGYYLAMMAVMFEGSTFIKIMSYVPLISALLSPALYIIGEVTLIDVFISILLTVGIVYILYKYGLKIYKVGILNYSSTNLWKKMFKALKNN